MNNLPAGARGRPGRAGGGRRARGDGAGISIRRRAALLFSAARLYAFPASVVPILLGSVYARHLRGVFLPGHFILALAAGMLFHTAANLLNDYYDYRYGVDREGALGGSGFLVAGTMTPRQFALGAWACLAAGTLIGLYFVCRYGAPIFALGAAGLLGAVFYTATPCGLKYHALGEPLVFLTMGVGMVLGGWMTQGAPASARACAAGLPVSFLVAAILQANDVRDIRSDRLSGVRTASVLLGARGARRVYYLLLASAYASLAGLAALRIVPPASLLAALSLPLAWRLCTRFRGFTEGEGGRLGMAPHETAVLHLVFGLLMTAGIAAAGAGGPGGGGP